MKLKIITAILILISITSKAQDSKSIVDNFYFSATGIVGNFYGGDVSLNYIHNNKVSFQFSFSEFQRRDPSRPNDYEGGLTDLFKFGGYHPNEKLESFAILGGLVLPYKGSKKGRWNLKAGMAYSKYSKPIDYKEVDAGLIGNLFTSNYTWEKVRSEELSIILKPELEIAFAQYFGAGLQSTIIYNNQTFIVGLGISLKFGFVRGKMSD